MNTQPLVSCIMPTYNRRCFVPQAIEYFLRQDYPEKELIILDDGNDSIADLIPVDPRIRYLRQEHKSTTGAKRNAACEEACGEIIVHWDDDDWMSNKRLSYQVDRLTGSETDICGLSKVLFFEPAANRCWEYRYTNNANPWVCGATLCYRKEFWRINPFPNINIGEDTRFVWDKKDVRILALPDYAFLVAIIHPGNTSPKRTNGSEWNICSVEKVRQILGSDLHFYQSNQPIPAEPSTIFNAHSEKLERTIPMITVAKESDLELPEYIAFNKGQSLPRMRSWELPFVLFQSHLSNSMAILDCTINPVNFQERLARLYPQILYRHWNPIKTGQFQLPLGHSDESFDRVICVNTLEHLLRPQRETLISEMARKLKSGGWLILTSDFYFDSFWQQPAILQTGLIRADHQEVFNGFNKVTVSEYNEMCRANGLSPMLDEWEEPSEAAPTLFRQQPPFPHACIAGVYCKGPAIEQPSGKIIVLALLTWNTRDVSLDSVRAIMKEARMLNRLGQEAFICVCDNGSVDGTAEALRALESEIECPHKFIFNPENLGNSVARNQIIEYMLEVNADYILFMDGDIEIVPFSSFAMLRYMENNGRRLGCIGACSAGQTPCRERASQSFYSVEQVETTNLVAWTQYGMFRREVFDDGIRFDDKGPFTGPGWGFEDNDLAFQMEMKGYVNQRFFGMTYLHRDARSSIRIMRQFGIDAEILYMNRKQYVIEKWSTVPKISNGPLHYVRTVNIRL